MDKNINPALQKAEDIAFKNENHTFNTNSANEDLAKQLEHEAENTKYRAMDKPVKGYGMDNKNTGDNYVKKDNNRPRYGGFISAIVVLSLSVLALSGVVASLYTNKAMKESVLETSYKRAFYESVTYVDNIDLNMAKTMASNDTLAEQKYLNDVIVNAELCENALSELPLQDESKFYTVKLINQVGDYSKYLVNKLIDGNLVSETEWKNFDTLRDGVLNLKETLQKVTDEGDFSFKDIDKEDNVLLKNLNSLQNLSSDYPELIYDGPFSDGRLKKQPKGLTGAEISLETATKQFNNYFKDYGVSKISSVGDSSSQINAYTFSAITSKGELFAEISKKEGKLILFTLNETGNSASDVDGATERQYSKALDFLDSVGVKKVKPVWSAVSGGYMTINLVSVDNGVIIYPDMIKVKLSLTDDTVVGYEAFGYYMSHVKRELPKVTVSEASAKSVLNPNFKVKSSRLVLIPTSEDTESLCYEFSALLGEDTYYIYISATTCRQVEMFKVVSGTEGELLM